MNKLSLQLRVYVACVTALGAAALAIAALARPGIAVPHAGLALALALLIALEIVSSVKLSYGEESESHTHEETFLVVLVLLLPPFAVLAALAAGLILGNALVRRAPVKSLFNVGQLVASAGLAVLVTRAIGLPAEPSAHQLAAVVAGLVTFFVANNCAIALLFALLRADFGRTFVATLPARTLVSLGNVSLGLLAGTAASSHRWTLAFGLPAIATLHLAFAGNMRAHRDRQRLADLVNSTSDGILSADRDGIVRSWNPALERITGVSAAEAVGSPLTRLLPAASAPRAGELVELMTAGGEQRWLQLGSSPLPEGGTVVVAHDETERRRASELEDELRQSQKMEAIGRLAGGVAHDFNNLLTAITGYSEILLRKLAGAPERHDVEQIAGAAERAAGLTRRLLAFSRRQVLNPSVLDLNGAIADVERLLERVLGEDVVLLTILDPETGHVRADESQLTQVVLNLCVNARDAMPDGGTLTIASSSAEVASERYSVIRVTDTGIGMDAATQAKIFEPFFTTKDPGKGTGLGLATVYGIVAQSGGHIRVESQPGFGTTFSIYLPRVEEEAVEPAVEEIVPAPGDETVLLVEDDDLVRGLARKQLEEQGYRVLVAACGEDALEIFAEDGSDVDLLLTDVVMPGMSGPELAGRLTTARPGLPVLYTSGYTGDGPVSRRPLEPAAPLVRKPFTAAVLGEHVRLVLDSAAS